MLQRITTVAILMLLATPAAAEWRILYLSALFGSGCSVTFVSPEYAARPVRSDGSRPNDRAKRAGYHPKIAAENVASGQKSFGDVLRGWEESSVGTTCCFRT